MLGLSAVVGVLLAIAALVAVSRRAGSRRSAGATKRAARADCSGGGDAEAPLAAIETAVRGDTDARGRRCSRHAGGAAHNRPRPRRPAADHRHQRDHLLPGQIFAAAGFATPASQTAATTWAIGGVNASDAHCAIASSTTSVAAAAAGRPRRHGAQPYRGGFHLPAAR